MTTQTASRNDLRVLADIDRVIHEPARLMILAILSAAEQADFLYLQRETGLTAGNLSSHLARLEEAGYISIDKTFRGKLPLTTCRLTADGKRAFTAYRQQLAQVLAAQ
jgi:DNA-binding transcriptional ArsR family regulator